MQAPKAVSPRRAPVPPPTPALAAEVRQSAFLLALLASVAVTVTVLTSALQWMA